MATTIKTLVSKKKQRYVEDGYNLDLSYINDRVIAMGFPAENIEALYRNSLDEVKKFLDQKHADHYMIYNLCSEKNYDKSKFHGRVKHFPFDDHHPPNFSLIGPFCEDVHAWLSQDERNVAAVHCKAGKGRTGVMICCYLLYSGFSNDAQGVLDFYGQKRTMDEKGVTIPSQKRYIHYYDRLLRRGLFYETVKLYLRCIVLDPVPAFKNIGRANDCLLQFEVSQRRRATTYESPWFVVKRVDRQVRLEVNPPLLISDDVKIEFFTKPKLDFVGLNSKMFRKSSKEFHFWLNTFFVDADMNGGLAHDILTKDSSSASLSGNASSEQTTGSLSGDSNSQVNPFFNVSLPSQRTLQDIDITKPWSNAVQDDRPKPKFTVELARRLSEQGSFESPVILVEPDADQLPAAHHQTVVSMASLVGSGSGGNVMSITDLMKTHSLQLSTSAHAEQSSVQHVTVVPEMSNASSSSSSSVSLTSAPLSVPPPNMSFIEKRTRHASVPQTSSSPGAMSHVLPQANGGKKQGHSSGHSIKACGLSSASACPTNPIDIKGTNISLRLNKSQIDGATKDKHCKVFNEKFHVILFFTKPTDQSDNLVDFSLQEASCSAGQNPHHITVTPVPAGFGEPQKKKKKTKGMKKSEHKSRKSLMNFGARNKVDSSSDEEHDTVDRLHAITFDERLSLTFRQKSGDLSDPANVHTVHAFPTANQSDWI